MKNNKLKIISKIFRSLFIFEILFIIFNLNLVRSASAQELSVAIDPPILQIQAKTPSLIKNPISIINQGDQTVTYSIFLVPFKAGGLNNGLPEFNPVISQEYKNIFSKIQVSDESQSLIQITLAPKQKKDLTLSIRINKDEPPRDYYFSVIFISEGLIGQNQSSQASARGGIGTNVLLSIGPKSPTRASIEEFSAPLFVTKGPVKFKLNISNQSKHYIQPEGNLVIRNIFGQTVGNIDLIPANILSESKRYIESESNPDPNQPVIYWNENFLLGLYKADLTVALSEDGPIIKKTLRFFAFPAEAVLGIVLVLILLAGMIKRARRI